MSNAQKSIVLAVLATRIERVAKSVKNVIDGCEIIMKRVQLHDERMRRIEARLAALEVFDDPKCSQCHKIQVKEEGTLCPECFNEACERHADDLRGH